MAPEWEAGEAWRIAPEPDVVIGEVGGDESYVLSQVYSARRFSDGRIAVLDGGSGRVRIYDSGGVHIRDFGGTGDGPAEFRFPQKLRLLGDTVVVFEGSPPTVVRFRSDGTFISRTRLGPASGEGAVLFGTAFGYLSEREGVFASEPSDRPWLAPGLQREETVIWRYSLDSHVIDPIATVRTREITVRVRENGRLAWRDVPFGKTTFLAASNDRIYAAPTENFSILVLDRAGRLTRIIRREDSRRPATQADYRRYVRQALVSQGIPEEEIEPRVAAANVDILADSMPSHHFILADTEDNLWVEEFDDVGVVQGGFSVFDSAGIWLGEVEFPPGLQVFRSHPTRAGQFEIGPDFLLGVWADELGVEQVRLYRIIKG